MLSGVGLGLGLGECAIRLDYYCTGCSGQLLELGTEIRIRVRRDSDKCYY
jgi:hypothetical protein